MAVNTNAVFLHATLTVGGFKNLLRGIEVIERTLIKARTGAMVSWSKVVGGYWILEVEWRKERKYAPHLHALLVLDGRDPPAYFRSIKFAWARMARQVIRPDEPFDPRGSGDALLKDLTPAQSIERLSGYGYVPFTLVPRCTTEVEKVLEDVWNVAGYTRKTKRILMGGGSKRTRHLSLPDRLALHKSRVRRRDSFGVMRAERGKAIDFEYLGRCLARILGLGPFRGKDPTQSGLVPHGRTPIPPLPILTLLRTLLVSPNDQLRSLARAALDLIYDETLPATTIRACSLKARTLRSPCSDNRAGAPTHVPISGSPLESLGLANALIY